jgi:hypothetical protein
MNIRAFPAFLQDRRGVQTTSSASGSPNVGRGADLAIFPGIWAHASHRLSLERMAIGKSHAGLVAGSMVTPERSSLQRPTSSTFLVQELVLIFM